MKEEDRVSLAQNVRNLRDNVPALLELAGINAQLMRAKYLALMKEGFTEAQALDLCWRMQ